MNRAYPLLFATLAATISLSAREIRGQDIKIDASRVLGPVSRYLTGACIEDVNHEIYGGIYSQMLFGESFQEPPPGPGIEGFSSFGGNWLVADGVVRIHAADGPKLISDRARFRDGTIGVELKFAERNGVNAGLIVRVEDPKVGADRFIGYEISLDPANQKLRLARHRNNYEPIKDVDCELAIGRWIALEVRLTDSVIEILVDGKSILRHDDGKLAIPNGRVGLRAWHREASYRNLWVKTGESIEKLPFKKSIDSAEVSGMWQPIRRGTALGSYRLNSDRPFTGSQSQRIAFASGEGEWGIENQGLNRWGLNFAAGRQYEGYIWARAEKPTILTASIESRDGTHAYATTNLNIAKNDWQRLDFTLTPNNSDTAGRFVLSLRQPGSVEVGHAFLQPSEWGRFKGLPVRRDVAEALVEQGITVLRYGGSMVNNAGYRWKKMIGPRDRRPPYSGQWYRYSSNGWAILDFMNFCEAAGFEYVPAFDINESAQDMADFVDYAKGPSNSNWGQKRVADGHPSPYRLRYLELGNEERVDEKYAAKFSALATAIWAKDPGVILVVGDFAYDRSIKDPMNFAGAASRITNMAGQAKILELARQHGREVWFDVHIDTDGPGLSSSLKALSSYIDALEKIAAGAKHKVVVFEYNAGNHGMRRALANATATIRVERDGRIPIVTSANCLQPDKQNDNGWDQGLLFLNPSKVWLQPPGFVTQMLSQNYLPQQVKCVLSENHDRLEAIATRSESGETLVLQVVSISNHAVPLTIQIAGFSTMDHIAKVTELSGPLDAVNTAENPGAIAPKHSDWKHEIKNGECRYVFPAQSFTIIRWQKSR
jgi:hypothetical protein